MYGRLSGTWLSVRIATRRARSSMNCPSSKCRVAREMADSRVLIAFALCLSVHPRDHAFDYLSLLGHPYVHEVPSAPAGLVPESAAAHRVYEGHESVDRLSGAIRFHKCSDVSFNLAND